MIRLEALQKLDITTQNVIYEAMLKELIERRNVKDPELFTHCFVREAPEEGNGYLEWITDFSEIAGEAFAVYHDLRANGARMDGGKVVFDTDTPVAGD